MRTQSLVITSYSIHYTKLYEFVFIIQNYKPITSEFQLAVGNMEGYNFKAYLTSTGNDENLKLVSSGSAGDTLTLPGNSVMTVVIIAES